MINIKLEKKDLWLLAAVMVFVVGVGYVIAWNSGNPAFMGHNSDNVFIYLNGNSKNLQTSINNGDFYSPFSGGSSYSGDIVQGHPGENIIVNVGGNVKSFQQAINDGSLCNAITGTSPANFGAETYGNTGNEIRVTIDGVNKDLQTAINDGNLSGCVRIYVKASSTKIPTLEGYSGVLRRTIPSPCTPIQVVMIFNGYRMQDFNSSAPITILPGGAQSYQQQLSENATAAKVIGLFKADDILNTILTNGQISANFTGRMIARKTYLYGNSTIFISTSTGC